MMDIKQALTKAYEQLHLQSPSARIDAEILLAHALQKSRTYLQAFPERLISSDALQQYHQLLNKRVEGIPIAYLIEYREFWSLPIKVNQHTLIPRPETEQLVELVLKLLYKQPKALVLDLGTGSGAIALALASERPNWQIIASDASKQALEIAQENAQSLGFKNIHFIHSDWFAKISQTNFSAIISNPPYIEENDPHLLLGDVRFEPQAALASGADGLEAISQIIEQSPFFLKASGVLLLEHGYNQKIPVVNRLKRQKYKDITCWQDLQGHDRATGAWKK